jgi:hypothetical protein
MRKRRECLGVLTGIVLAACCIGATQPAAVEEKYDSGKVKERFTTNPDGAKHGPWTAFDEDGKKTATGEYRDGKKSGLFREFTAEKVTSEQFYIDDMLAYPRSQAQIAAKLADIRRAKVTLAKTDNVPALPKTLAGKQSDQDREAAVRTLNEYRYLCNVPADIALDATYNVHCEAAAALLTQINRLDHHPKNPGWPEDDYQLAKKGCASSNLFMGSRASSPIAVHAWMNDSDPSNVDRLGHRRWCVNPSMARTGFGQAGAYVAMWSFDKSRETVPDYDFVSFPAPGLFPNSHFDASYAWHISLNPSKYQRPDKAKVKLSVKPAQVAKNPPAIRTAPELKVASLTVDNGGAGISNAIIFRFEKCSTQPGTAYLVEITGLETSNSEPASVKYLVEFYSPSR